MYVIITNFLSRIQFKITNYYSWNIQLNQATIHEYKEKLENRIREAYKAVRYDNRVSGSTLPCQIVIRIDFQATKAIHDFNNRNITNRRLFRESRA